MATVSALPEMGGVKQRLQDPFKMCRLCFQTPGTHDVSVAPYYLRAIKQLYNIVIQPTDRYTKSVCEKCIGSIQEFSMHQELVKAGQHLYSKRIEMFEQMSHMKAEPCSTDREGPSGDSNSQPLAMVDKHEDISSDLDMDDVITEAPTSPQNRSPTQTPVSYYDQDVEDVVVLNKRAHEKDVDREHIQSLKIKRTTDAAGYSIVPNDKEKRSIQNRPKTPINIKKEPSPRPNERNTRTKQRPSQPKELNALLRDDYSNQAGRISKRRSTMASQCEESARHGRKRRLSSTSKSGDNAESAGISHRTRNSSGGGSGVGDDVGGNTPKRMRVDQSPAKSASAAVAAQTIMPKRNDATKSTPAHVNSNINSNTLISNVVAASVVDTTVTPTVTISTPRTNKSLTRLNKYKAISTRPITQFFTQQKTSTPAATRAPDPAKAFALAPVPLKCDKCSIILSSINELNFHTKSHEMKCCVKCKKAIDTDESPIGAHVISCFFLDNKVPNDLLTRFLKVKVDLDRLTPIKIKQIQKKLQSNESQNLNNATDKPSLERANRRQSKDRSRRESTSTTENHAQTSINDKSLDVNKNDQDRHGLKKSKNKKHNNNKSSSTKNVYNEPNDGLMITENAAAALNWNDEPNKDKLFTMRNFECDANIYINIKEVLSSESDDTQKKVSTFVKRISFLKQKASAPQSTASPIVQMIQKPIVTTAQPSSAIAAAKVSTLAAARSKPPTVNNSNALAVTTAAKTSVVSGVGHGQMQQKQSANARQLSSMQTPAQIQTLQNTLARHNIPNVVSTQNASSPIASVQNVSYTAVSLHALNATPLTTITNMPQSPLVACAPHAPLANMQPLAYAPNVPNASNTPNVPQLLDLPQRLQSKNRRYSIHFAPNEQIPSHITARRQSFGGGILTPSHAIQSTQPGAAAAAAAAAAAQEASDHTYTRSTMSNSSNYYHQNGQRPTPPPPPPSYMTTIHAQDIAVKNSPTPNPMTTLKVLTVDDLNSRAASAVQPVTNNRTDSPNSTENNSNLNNNQPPIVKRVRTKTTPMRNGGVFISDDANVTISVSLSRLGTDQAELSLTTDQHGKISYDALTDKRKQEVQSSLLKDDVWLKMLTHLKSIRPTNETMLLFKQILPAQEHNTFMTELRNVYGNRI